MSSLCNDLYFLNQTICQISVTLIQISEGKTTELLLRDLREIYHKRTYNIEHSKLKIGHNKNIQRTIKENNLTTLPKNKKKSYL